MYVWRCWHNAAEKKTGNSSAVWTSQIPELKVTGWKSITWLTNLIDIHLSMKIDITQSNIKTEAFLWKRMFFLHSTQIIWKWIQKMLVKNILSSSVKPSSQWEFSKPSFTLELYQCSDLTENKTAIWYQRLFPPTHNHFSFTAAKLKVVLKP